MSKHLTPLQVAEALIGGLSVVADICGVNEKAPYLWRRAAKLRCAGDFPSSSHQRKILEFSDERALGLTADHVIYGATEQEIADIIASRTAAQVAA